MMHQFIARAGAEVARGISTALIVRGGAQQCPACEPVFICGVCPVLDCPLCPECHCAPQLQCPSLEFSPNSSFHQEGVSLVVLLGCLAVATGAGYLAGRRGVAWTWRPSPPPASVGTAAASATGPPLPPAKVQQPPAPAALTDVAEEARRQARQAAAAALARR